MNKHLITALSIAIFAATSGGAIAAQAGDHEGHERKHRFHRAAGMHEGGDPQRMFRHLARSLELDETQQQELENILSAAKPETEALHERAEANRETMRQLDINDSNYHTRLNELAAEKGAIATDRALLHGRLRSEIDAVLTPEQRQELAGKSEEMRHRLEKRKEAGPRG
jgi:Spy/CpxP family protein refolding chaperone